MSKRFTDTALWEKEWFQQLPPKYKLFWFFVKDRCDAAGVWSVNKTFANFLIGESIDLKEALEIFSEQIKEIAPGKWWIIDFITFQYGRLSENCAPHRAVLAMIEKHNLKGSVTLTLPLDDSAKKEQDDSKSLLSFPTNGSPKLWHLTEKQVAEWTELYPGIDVLAECRKALAWVMANNKKTAKGMTRYLNGWLSRTNDKPRGSKGGEEPKEVWPVIPTRKRK